MPNRTTMPPSDCPMTIHLECRAYDAGCRHNLIGQLRTVLETAANQERRSAQTASRPPADRLDKGNHARDILLARELNEVIRRYQRRGCGAAVGAEPDRRPPRPDTLPLLLSTDLGYLDVLVREDDAWGMLPPDVWPYPVKIEAFGAGGRRIATLPLTLEQVQRIHAAFGALLDQQPAALWEQVCAEHP